MGGRSSSFGKRSSGGSLGIGAMPSLEGTDKQVKWANEVRDQYKDQFTYFQQHYLDKGLDLRQEFEKENGRKPTLRELRRYQSQPGVRDKVKANNELGTKQDVSKQFTETLAYKGYNANEYTGIKERSDFKTEKEYRDYLVKGARKAFNEKSASWWIDHRQK